MKIGEEVPLSLDFHNMPGFLIRRLHQISLSVVERGLNERDLPITPVQYAALSALSAYPGIGQSSLAGLIAYDRVTIGSVLDRLEKRNFVKREINANDRRARSLVLTKEGEKILKASKPVIAAQQNDMLQGLSKTERKEFMRLLNKTVEAGNSDSRAPLISP